MTRRFLLLGWFLLTATSAWSANDLSAVDEACHGELEDYDLPQANIDKALGELPTAHAE